MVHYVKITALEREASGTVRPKLGGRGGAVGESRRQAGAGRVGYGLCGEGDLADAVVERLAEVQVVTWGKSGEGEGRGCLGWCLLGGKQEG